MTDSGAGHGGATLADIAGQWRMRTDAPWRDVPALYTPWSTEYGRFRRW
ncbi:transposase [Nonomuraea sp. NPDC001699]